LPYPIIGTLEVKDKPQFPWEVPQTSYPPCGDRGPGVAAVRRSVPDSAPGSDSAPDAICPAGSAPDTVHGSPSAPDIAHAPRGVLQTPSTARRALQTSPMRLAAGPRHRPPRVAAGGQGSEDDAPCRSRARAVAGAARLRSRAALLRTADPRRPRPPPSAPIDSPRSRPAHRGSLPPGARSRGPAPRGARRIRTVCTATTTSG